MPEKLERVARRLFDDVWNRGDLNVLGQILTEDYVNYDPSEPARGIDATRQMIAKYRGAFPDCRLQVDETLSAGDQAVIVRWRYSGTHQGPLDGLAPTGRKVEGTGLTLYHFAGDRIKDAYTNWDVLGLMQQLGVVTLPGKAHTAGA